MPATGVDQLSLVWQVRSRGSSMPTSVIEHIRRVVDDGAGLRDGELLGRYVDRRDEAALAALVNRHGPMVWGVCRRLLGHHDAEDAFQATFIVLVRKASSIAHGEDRKSVV